MSQTNTELDLDAIEIFANQELPPFEDSDFDQKIALYVVEARRMMRKMIVALRIERAANEVAESLRKGRACCQ